MWYIYILDVWILKNIWSKRQTILVLQSFWKHVLFICGDTWRMDTRSFNVCQHKTLDDEVSLGSWQVVCGLNMELGFVGPTLSKAINCKLCFSAPPKWRENYRSFFRNSLKSLKVNWFCSFCITLLEIIN